MSDNTFDAIAIAVGFCAAGFSMLEIQSGRAERHPAILVACCAAFVGAIPLAVLLIFWS